MTPKPLTSNREAIDVGFSEGAKLRQDGAKPEDQISNLALYEEGFPLERGARSLFHKWWHREFEAGFLGKPKTGCAALRMLLHTASFRYAAEFDRNRDIADINQAADQVRSVMMRAGLDR